MPNIHPTAVLGDAVRLGADVEIGPYCVVDGDVVLGDGVKLLSHVVVTGRTTIGAGTTLFSFSCVGHRPQDLKYAGEASRITIGQNCSIREFTTVHPGTQGGGMITSVGDDCLLMATTHVAHDCRLGNGVILSNGTQLAGHVSVDDHAILGGMVGAHQHVRVGRHAFVGGMSALTKDVLPFTVAFGNPATMRGLNSVGLKRRGFTHDQLHLLRTIYQDLFADEGTFDERFATIERAHGGDELVAQIVSFIRGNSARSFTGPRLNGSGQEE